MIRDADPNTDALGRPRTKVCPECTAEIGRTLQKCPECGHEFIGHDRAAKLRGKPGRPAKFDIDAPEPESLLLALAESKVQIPEAARFVASRTPEGGIRVCWPDWDIKFTFSPGERMILRSVV